MIDPTLYVERLLEIDRNDPHRGERDNPLDEKRRDIIHEYLTEFRKQNPPLSVEQMSPLQKAQYQLIANEVQKILDAWVNNHARGFNASGLSENAFNTISAFFEKGGYSNYLNSGFINVSPIALTLSSLLEKEGCRKVLWSLEESQNILNPYNSYYVAKEKGVLGCVSAPWYSITVTSYFEELDRKMKHWQQCIDEKKPEDSSDYANKELLQARERMSMGEERLDSDEFAYYVFYEGLFFASEFAHGNTNLYKWNGFELEHVESIGSWIS
jgi:hypothetical protein